MIKPTLFTVFFLASALLATGQSLWQNTSYGMSVAQVREAIPAAIAPKDPAKLASGAVERLRVEEFTVVHAPFAVHFYFEGAKLVQVSLEGKKEESFTVSLPKFESLVDVLRSKYGAEISKRRESGVLNIAEATWNSGKTNINLLLVGAHDVASLNLNYQVRLSREAEKL